MDHIVISGVKPWDGRYPFDIAENEPTTREWGWIKRLSGYLPTTIEQGIAGADPELICAFAAIAIRRAGKAKTDEVPGIFERLADAPFGAAVQLELDQADVDELEGGDAGPPARNANGSSGSSGSGSTESSEISPLSLVTSGMPGSDTSASEPTRSAS